MKLMPIIYLFLAVSCLGQTLSGLGSLSGVGGTTTNPPSLLWLADTNPAILNAYTASGLNGISIAKNQLCTAGTHQYGVYYNTNLHLCFTDKDLSSGITTITTTTNLLYLLQLPYNNNDDEHKIASLEFDKTGFGHCFYGAHATNLLYIRTSFPYEVTNWTGLIYPLVSSLIETRSTYPFLFKDNAGELYLTFRKGDSGTSDQIMYQYNTTTTAWAQPSKWVDATCVVWNGLNTPTSSQYLNGLPKFDSSGNLWWSLSLKTIGTNQYLFKFATDGNIYNFDGSLLSYPLNIGNVTPALSGRDFNVQCDFCLTSNGVAQVAYTRLGNQWNLFVMENSTGNSVTEHQLTLNRFAWTANFAISSNDRSINNLNPYPYPSIVSVNGTSYVVLPNNFPGEMPGIVCYKSSDNFETWTKFYLSNTYSPNWALNPDPEQIKSNTVSFLFGQINDYQFGKTFAPTNGGPLQLINWRP